MVVKRTRILSTYFIQYILNVNYKILGGIKKDSIEKNNLLKCLYIYIS